MTDISLELQTTASGDLLLLSDSEALLQEEDIIIQSYKGQIKTNILLGVGIVRFINGPSNILNIKFAIKQELSKVGIKFQNIKIVDDEF